MEKCILGFVDFWYETKLSNENLSYVRYKNAFSSSFLPDLPSPNVITFTQHVFKSLSCIFLHEHL